MNTLFKQDHIHIYCYSDNTDAFNYWCKKREYRQGKKCICDCVRQKFFTSDTFLNDKCNMQINLGKEILLGDEHSI